MRWNLLAWEDSHHTQWAVLFRTDVETVEARVAAPGPHPWRRLVPGAGARYSGLRLLDGALVLKVRQGRETGQIRVVDGAAFDPALSGLEAAMRRGARGSRALMKSLDGIVLHRRRNRPRSSKARGDHAGAPRRRPPYSRAARKPDDRILRLHGVSCVRPAGSAPHSPQGKVPTSYDRNRKPQIIWLLLCIIIIYSC